MPAKKQKSTKKTNTNGATVGYEAELWKMADALRGSMDAAEYKHVVLGLIFLKYISDAFEEQHARLEVEKAQGADPEDPDEYRAKNIFWVPPEARWSHLKSQAKQPTIGELVDDAMVGIERDNPSLKGVLPKDYARPALDKQRLGQLIDLISNIRIGDVESRAKDVLGRVYEYFLSQFASAEGKKGGEFYTPRCVVKLLVEMLEPYKGRVYDPCCGYINDKGSFRENLKEFRKAGHVTDRDADLIEKVIDVGHASTHRAYFPNELDLRVCIDVVKHLMHGIYALKPKMDVVAKSTPKRTPPSNGSPGN
jgi:type I restriction enzyme M protein